MASWCSSYNANQPGQDGNQALPIHYTLPRLREVVTGVSLVCVSFELQSLMAFIANQATTVSATVCMITLSVTNPPVVYTQLNYIMYRRRSAAKDMRNRALGMNFLVAGGTTAAYLYSVVLLVLAMSTAQVRAGSPVHINNLFVVLFCVLFL